MLDLDKILETVQSSCAIKSKFLKYIFGKLNIKHYNFYEFLLYTTFDSKIEIIKTINRMVHQYTNDQNRSERDQLYLRENYEIKIIIK